MGSRPDWPEQRQLDHAEWNQAVRGETELQTRDRHFNELLQELLLLALVGAVQLAASFILGAWATLLATALAGLFAMLWFVIPLIHRIRHQHRPEASDSA